MKPYDILIQMKVAIKKVGDLKNEHRKVLNLSHTSNYHLNTLLALSQEIIDAEINKILPALHPPNERRKDSKQIAKT